LAPIPPLLTVVPTPLDEVAAERKALPFGIQASLGRLLDLIKGPR
jgi:hypothetical protein